MWNLRVIRVKRHMSLQELADRIGSTATEISRWELGRVDPSLKNLRKLSEVLNCTIDEITEDTDERVS